MHYRFYASYKAYNTFLPFVFPFLFFLLFLFSLRLLPRGLRCAPGFPRPATEARWLPPGFPFAVAACCRPEFLAATTKLQPQYPRSGTARDPAGGQGARGVERAPHTTPPLTSGLRAVVRPSPSGGVGTGREGELRCVYSKSKELLGPGTCAPLSFPARGAIAAEGSFGDGCAGGRGRAAQSPFPSLVAAGTAPFAASQMPGQSLPGSCHPYGSLRGPPSLVFNLLRVLLSFFVVVRKHPQLKAI